MWIRKPVLRCKTSEPSFTVRFSPDDRIVLSGHFDGTVVGYEVSTGANKFEFNVTPRENRSKIPVTSCAFRPGGGKPLLLVGCSNGSVDRWELRSLEKAHSIREENNEVYAVEYRSDGSLFASAGRDAHLRIYDDTTGQLVHSYATVGESANPAATRLYSINFPKDDPNLVMTSGWGKTVFIYDMRIESAVQKPKEIFGPYIAGDALSSSADTILTASHRLEDRVQLWDRTTLVAVKIPWPTKNQFLPSCAKFSNDANCEFIAVGGSGSGIDCKEGCWVWDRKNSKLAVEATFEKAINSCAFANRESIVAFGDGEGQVHVFDQPKAPEKKK
jgi:COMPASS component SWD3